MSLTPFIIFNGLICFKYIMFNVIISVVQQSSGYVMLAFLWQCSRTCLERQPLLPSKSGLSRQVVPHNRYKNHIRPMYKPMKAIVQDEWSLTTEAPPPRQVLLYCMCQNSDCYPFIYYCTVLEKYVYFHFQYGTDFFILDKFPMAVRPFYTMPDPNNPVSHTQ